MKVGLFDHVEQTGDRSLATIFDERLRFAQLADEAGFYCLHVAEHRIIHREHRMALRHGGHITRHEQMRLNREESRIGQHIPG